MGDRTALVGVVAVELVASAIYAQVYDGGTIFTGLETVDHPSLVPQVLRYPELDEQAYRHHADRRAPPRRAGSVRHVGAAAAFEKGYLWMASPDDWPALAPSRGTLFEVLTPRLQPRPAPSLLAVHPGHEPPVGLLQRRCSTCLAGGRALLGLYLVVPTGSRHRSTAESWRRPTGTRCGSWPMPSRWPP